MASPKTLTFKAEIEFAGKIEDFVKFTEAVFAAGAKIDFGSNKIPQDINAGYIAPRYLRGAVVAALLKETKVDRFPTLINGGIRTPHFHLGNEIALVDREQFKKILGEVARDVFENRAALNDDFLEAVIPLADIGR